MRFIDPDGMNFSDFEDEDDQNRNNKKKRHVEDGSTAQYKMKGKGVNKHYEFTGFNEF